MKPPTLDAIISDAKKRLEIICFGGRHRVRCCAHWPIVQRCRPGERPAAGGLLIFDPAVLDLILVKPKEKIQAFLQDLTDGGAFLLAFSNSFYPPEDWISHFDRYGIPWCVSRHDPYLLESRLRGIIREMTEGVKMIHAGLVEVNGWGILITGEAGSGKTCLALELLRRGHRWIADDVVLLKKKAPDLVVGSAHERTKGLLHLRGKGIHAMTAYGSPFNLREEAVVKLVFELPVPGERRHVRHEREDKRRMMGVSVPVVRGGSFHGEGGMAWEFEKIVYRSQLAEACG